MNIDAWNYCQNELIPRVKGLAGEKILAFLPLHRQINYNARMNELNMIHHDREWTSEETAEVNAMLQIWKDCCAIRDASNVHEASILTLTTLEEVAQYDIYSNWP